MEEKAARAYDLAALKYWGPSTHINFPVCFNSGGIFGSYSLEPHFLVYLAARKLPN